MASKGAKNNFRQNDERMKYVGTDEWVNLRTGEKKQIDKFEKPIGRAPGTFMIAYLAEIISLIDKLGNQKMQVVKYILTNMNKSNNTLIITYRELAEKSKTSYKTVCDTIKLLKEAGLVSTRTGAIMMNPALMNNKKASGEATMMVQYRDFSKTTETEEIEGQMEIADIDGNMVDITTGEIVTPAGTKGEPEHEKSI